MPQNVVSRLYDRHSAVAFYQDRFGRGYMSAWPAKKIHRVIEVIRGLDLPDCGEALDFGCGRGLFTKALQAALPPGWQVYGTDISEAAIEQAKRHCPDCRFFVSGDGKFEGKQFDFLFSHHVLEHVHNIDEALDEINAYLKTNASVLHILPCGNEGSFEHSICMLRSDGINSNRGNRFFYEDEGHLRRMTSSQLSELCAKRQLMMIKEFYSNQYYGAIDWITYTHIEFIKTFTDNSRASDQKAARKLEALRYMLAFIWLIRLPATIIDLKFRKQNKSMLDYILIPFAFLFYCVSMPLDLTLKAKARMEWDNRKNERNGSEMYLYFKK
jgi:SAM-dependent methyltransferase